MINNKDQQEALIARIKRDNAVSKRRLKNKCVTNTSIERKKAQKKMMEVLKVFDNNGVKYRDRDFDVGYKKTLVYIVHNDKSVITYNIENGTIRKYGEEIKGKNGIDDVIDEYNNLLEIRRVKEAQRKIHDYDLFEKLANKYPESFSDKYGVRLKQNKIMGEYLKITGKKLYYNVYRDFLIKYREKHYPVKKVIHETISRYDD